MAIMRVNFDTKAFGSVLNGVIKALKNPQQALEQIGWEMVQRTQRGFDTQGRGPVQWPSKSVPNIPGIARRVSEGKTILPRYYEERPALIDSVTLKPSINFIIRGDTQLLIGTPLEYGQIHQDGIAHTIKNKIPELLKQGNKKAAREMAKLKKKYPRAAALLSSAEEIRIKPKRRPFLITTREDFLMFVEVLNMNFVNSAINEAQNGA
ncbi:MAG: hypothetical protein KDD43_08855 [Bdellovibrionales bacterium]|nr:hypothetical protein [Bdellovibrionales bacterium]